MRVFPDFYRQGMLIPNCGTRQGERRGEEGRETGLRRGNNTPMCVHEYRYVFRYTHLFLGREKLWYEHEEIAVPDKADRSMYRSLSRVNTGREAAHLLSISASIAGKDVNLF